jgi:hypothetical protein
MAARIIPFPKASEPNISEIERLIRLWLAEMSDSRDFVETITARMMAFINKYTNRTFEPVFNLAVPPGLSPAQMRSLVVSIETGVDNTAIQVQEMINRIIVERLFLEVEIYECGNRIESRNCPRH